MRVYEFEEVRLRKNKKRAREKGRRRERERESIGEREKWARERGGRKWKRERDSSPGYFCACLFLFMWRVVFFHFKSSILVVLITDSLFSPFAL